jgi:hypothetical protein
MRRRVRLVDLDLSKKIEIDLTKLVTALLTGNLALSAIARWPTDPPPGPAKPRLPAASRRLPRLTRSAPAGRDGTPPRPAPRSIGYAFQGGHEPMDSHRTRVVQVTLAELTTGANCEGSSWKCALPKQRTGASVAPPPPPPCPPLPSTQCTAQTQPLPRRVLLPLVVVGATPTLGRYFAVHTPMSLRASILGGSVSGLHHPGHNPDHHSWGCLLRGEPCLAFHSRSNSLRLRREIPCT